MMKPYHQRLERVYLILGESEVPDTEVEIPYSLPEVTYFDLQEIVESNGLAKRATDAQIQSFGRVLQRYGKVFSADPGITSVVTMDIELTDLKPIRVKLYGMSPRQTEILREEVKRLIDLGVIEIGQSEFTSPMILVEVAGKDPRLCCDYRRLNVATKAEFFPLPRTEEVVERVSAGHTLLSWTLRKGTSKFP